MYVTVTVLGPCDHTSLCECVCVCVNRVRGFVAVTDLAGVRKSVLKKALAAGEPGRDFRPGMCYCDKGKLERGNRQKGAGRLNEWPERGDSI